MSTPLVSEKAHVTYRLGGSDTSRGCSGGCSVFHAGLATVELRLCQNYWAGITAVSKMCVKNHG